MNWNQLVAGPQKRANHACPHQALDTPPTPLISDGDSSSTLRSTYDGIANEMGFIGNFRNRFCLDDAGCPATGEKDRRQGAEGRRKRHGMVEPWDELGRAALQHDDSD